MYKIQVTRSTTGVVAALLRLGFIPVLHGDGVLDDVKVRVCVC